MKSLKVLVALVVIAVVLFVVVKSNQLTAWKSSYIGITYPPSPKGVVVNDGGIIWAPVGTNPLYGFSYVTTPTGKEFWFLRTSVINNNPISTVTDALPQFSMEKNGVVLITHICGRDNPSAQNEIKMDLDDSIIALVNNDTYLHSDRAPALQAWKGNQVTEKFESISPSNVFCSYGP
ncbi:MAG: hypothetical protein EXS69_01885 [Candidatus Zambryskibacteria bacterium]|nr:hypothetical protein [Candidatus Zambryskibacteria bacterium]